MGMISPLQKQFLRSTSCQIRKKQLSPLCSKCSSPKFWRKLFTRSNKSQAGFNLEILVGAKRDRESCFTDIICRNCARNNQNVVKKVLEIKEQFSLSQEQIIYKPIVAVSSQ